VIAPARIGVIGCGNIARRQHIPLFLQAGATITAFASQSLASAQSAAIEAGGGAVCQDWRALLARDDVDAVTICTPNSAHAEQAIAAIKAGKHILVEKPFTVTVLEADSVIAAARAQGVVVMTAHSARFLPTIIAMQNSLQAGIIGAPIWVEGSLSHAGSGAWNPEATWFTDLALVGGGALLDLGVHLVDTLRWLLKDEFEQVNAILAGGVIEQDAFVTFRTRDGVIGNLHAGWRSTAGPQIGLTVAGLKGLLVLNDQCLVFHQPGAEPQALVVPNSTDSPQAAFLRAIRTGAAESPDAEDGRAAVAVVQACYRAAATGRSEKAVI
jgi:predicted dehydrogenase